VSRTCIAVEGFVTVLLLSASLALSAAPLAADPGEPAVADAAAVESAERPLDQVVEALVAEGLKRNLGLAGQQIDLERAEAVLREARASFRPQLDLQARYSRSEGGRNIEVPIADLLNPVYSSLNQLAPGSDFPQLESTSFALLREREQDTRLSLRQLIYAPAASANIDRRVAERDARVAASERFRGELARDIRIAFYDWSRARAGLGIIDASLAVLAENVRVSQALYDNGKVTRDQVLRAEAERLQLEQDRTRAESQVALARRYLNFLLDWPLDQQLAQAATSLSPELPPLQLPSVAELERQALLGRQELAELDAALRAAEAGQAAARGERLPLIAAQLDMGIQGDDYRFGSGSNQAIASIVLSVPITDGGARRAREAQARLSAERLRLDRQLTERSVRLQLRESLEQLQTALSGYTSATARVEAAREAFRIASRKRDVGSISQVEFIDAERASSQAELNLNLTRFDVLIRRAELAYAAALERPL
jgi:outer membrane protein TolC